MDVSVPRKSLNYIECKYEQLECISRGDFSSIYLAKDRVGSRMMAIKSVRMKGDEKRQSSYLQEINSLITLNRPETKKNRCLSILCFDECFLLEDLSSAFIVMEHIAGSTLAEWIETHPVCSERRITWYILQLSETLVYIRERGIAHFHLNPKRILVDANDGGKLVLTDFGSATPLRQDIADFTTSYAPPEMLEAKRSPDPESNLRKLDISAIDSFSLGCIALELVGGMAISKMQGLHGRCLGDYVEQRKGNVSDLVPQMDDDSDFSSLLRDELITRLLDPDPKERVNVAFLPFALRSDPRSPLLTPVLKASFPAIYRQHVIMDNISLGLLVQRGPDWNPDENTDGGEGSVGVVTALDPDALYTTVTWSTGLSETYRIGSKNKMEIVVGPPIFNGKADGLLMTENVAKYAIGQPYDASSETVHSDTGGMVVALVVELSDDGKGLICLVPRLMRKYPNDHAFIGKIPILSRGTHVRKITPHDPEPAPSHWTKTNCAFVSANRFVAVTDQREYDFVVAVSYNLLQAGNKILSIQRVQSERLWDAYARRREEIALENWGCPNELRLFHGTSSVSPETIINDPIGFDPRFCDRGAFGRGSYFAVNPVYSDAYSHVPPLHQNTCQMFLARVTLGRVQHMTGSSARDLRRPDEGYHSVKGASLNSDYQRSEIYILYETDTRAYPEYLITYASA